MVGEDDDPPSPPPDEAVKDHHRHHGKKKKSSKNRKKSSAATTASSVLRPQPSKTFIEPAASSKTVKRTPNAFKSTATFIKEVHKRKSATGPVKKSPKSRKSPDEVELHPVASRVLDPHKLSLENEPGQNTNAPADDSPAPTIEWKKSILRAPKGVKSKAKTKLNPHAQTVQTAPKRPSLASEESNPSNERRGSIDTSTYDAPKANIKFEIAVAGAPPKRKSVLPQIPPPIPEDDVLEPKPVPTKKTLKSVKPSRNKVRKKQSEDTNKDTEPSADKDVTKPAKSKRKTKKKKKGLNLNELEDSLLSESFQNINLARLKEELDEKLKIPLQTFKGHPVASRVFDPTSLNKKEEESVITIKKAASVPVTNIKKPVHIEPKPVESKIKPKPPPKDKSPVLDKSNQALLDYLNAVSGTEPHENAHEPAFVNGKIELFPAFHKFNLLDPTKMDKSILEKDTIEFGFGGLMQQYYSYVLRSYCLIYMHERYRGANRYSNCFTSIDLSGVPTREETMIKYAEDRVRRLDERREKLQSVSVDEDHFNYLKNLANSQATLLPLTIVHTISEEMAPVVEDIFRFYGKTLGNDHNCTKLAGFHFVRIRKRVAMYNHICGGSSLEEDLAQYFTQNQYVQT